MKLMYMELMRIINRGVCCLNRDQDQQMKHGMLGMYQRARQSSQNVKNATIEGMLKEIADESIRTRELPSELVRMLVKNGKAAEKATKAVTSTMKSLGLKIKTDPTNDGYDRKSASTEVLLFLDKREINTLVGAIMANFDELASGKVSPDTDKALDEFRKVGARSPIIALCGRFIAELGMNVNGALEVAHAMSCNEMQVIKDYFVAMDRLTNRVGGGCMTQDFGSNLMYEYCSVNLATLARNLSWNESLIVPTLAVFTKAFCLNTPQAKRTSSAEHSAPCFIRAIIKSEPLSGVDAFELPVKPGVEPLSVTATKRLLRFYDTKFNVYGKDGLKLDCCTWAPSPTEDKPLNIAEIAKQAGVSGDNVPSEVGSLSKLIEKVSAALK